MLAHPAAVGMHGRYSSLLVGETVFAVVYLSDNYVYGHGSRRGHGLGHRALSRDLVSQRQPANGSPSFSTRPPAPLCCESLEPLAPTARVGPFSGPRQ